MSYKLFVVNDTSADLHYGCDLVMSTIYDNCKVRGCEIVGKSLNTFSYDRVVSLVDKSKPDIVVINGEGTLHHSQPRALILAKVMHYLSDKGVRFFVINSTIQDNNHYILSALSKADKIYVRENCSNVYLSSFGINSLIIPDLSFGHDLEKYKSSIENISNKTYLFTDSVINNDTDALIKKLSFFCDYISLNHIRNGGLFYKTLRYILYLIAKIRVVFGSRNDKYLKLLGYQNDIDSFLCKVGSSNLVFGGRFHLVCICINMRIPFIAIESNTYKISGLVKDVGLSNDRVSSVDKLNSVDFDPYLFKYSQCELDAIDLFLKNTRASIGLMFDEILNN